MWVIVLAAISLGTPARIVAGNSGHRLVLTAAMLHALDAWDPTFRPWEDRDYQPGIISTLKFSSHEAPFAVFGDYNGDGHIDVAIDGRTKTNTVSIVLLSKGSAYRVIVLDETGLKDPKKEWYGVDTDRRDYGLWIFLGRAWPGEGCVSLLLGRQEISGSDYRRLKLSLPAIVHDCLCSSSDAVFNCASVDGVLSEGQAQKRGSGEVGEVQPHAAAIQQLR